MEQAYDWGLRCFAAIVALWLVGRESLPPISSNQAESSGATHVICDLRLKVSGLQKNLPHRRACAFTVV